MSGTWPFIDEKIAARLALIAPCVHRRKKALPPFRMLPLTSAVIDAPICADPSGWQEIPHESYWGAADLNFVLKLDFQVPPDWNPERMALHLPLGTLGDIFTHPEALVHVDGAPIGSADRYHHTLPLDRTLADGARHVLSLHGWTGLAGWPPDPDCKAQLFMGTPALVERDPGLQGFLTLAQSALETARLLPSESPEAAGLLAALDAAFKLLDTRDPLGAALYDSVPTAMEALQASIAQAGAPLDVTLHGIGHAHMDIAYLWPVSQIRLKNARTYTNVLRLMDTDPEFRFSHSQPQLYAMTAQDYPQLFDRIKARVAEGRWEVMGGMWVEPDLNIPGPEALVRQLTLGRGYFRDTFGDVETPVLWLPDTFGFPAQTPQLMRLAGLKWFVTNKLNWNQLNPVPSSSHHWQGLDGSRVLAHVLTTPRDVQYLPFPTNYKSDLTAPEVLGTWTRSTAPDSLRDLPICFGYGDGGGGPTEDLLAKARAYAAMPAMPQFRYSTVQEVFERIENTACDLPTWTGEHYLELHRGVYTSQAWIKRANRKAEWALHEAEALAAMAGQNPDLTEAWQLLCLNQFHDILTGTATAEVFEDARRDFARIMELAEASALIASAALALPVRSVANTSPCSGPRVALVPEASLPHGQTVEGGTLVLFDALPSYAIAGVDPPTAPHGPATVLRRGGTFVLENPTLVVTLDATGQVLSARDKPLDREVLAEGAVGNQLIAFEDRPISWDAWDIDPFYEDRSEAVAGKTTCEIVETGPLRASVRVATRWRSSTIRQHIRLSAHSNRIDFVTEVDWHESHTLLKAGFPTRIAARQAEFDIQWGRIARATTRKTAFDSARFEVPAQKWAQVADQEMAVALLNDCKYGYDVQGGTLRITLIKSATSPDPTADQGPHVFTYSLLPYDPATPEVLDREAYDLNAPLRVLPPRTGSSLSHRTFVTCSAPGVIVETLKPAADGQGVILRLFEARGQPQDTLLTFPSILRRAEVVSLFEDTLGHLETGQSFLEIALSPFQVLSLRVVL